MTTADIRGTEGRIPAPTRSRAVAWTRAAFVVALIAVGGSLYLSLGMGRKACALCFYQRAFALSLVAVLGMGLAARSGFSGRLSLLALPLAAAGLGVALFHVSLEVRDKLECPPGIFGWGTAPQQSVAVFAVLFLLLLAGAWWELRNGAVSWPALVGALVLGGLMAVASSIANPPPPPAPPQAYKEPIPDICRPPFRPQ